MQLILSAKKLVSVSATSVSVTEASMEDISLAWVSCIYYLVQFWKGSSQVQALLNSGSEVNAMNPAYAEKLGLRIRKTNVGTQKIDGSSLDTFGIVIRFRISWEVLGFFKKPSWQLTLGWM